MKKNIFKMAALLSQFLLPLSVLSCRQPMKNVNKITSVNASINDEKGLLKIHFLKSIKSNLILTYDTHKRVQTSKIEDDGYTHIFQFNPSQFTYNKSYSFDLFLDNKTEVSAVNNSSNFLFKFEKLNTNTQEKLDNSSHDTTPIEKEKTNSILSLEPLTEKEKNVLSIHLEFAQNSPLFLTYDTDKRVQTSKIIDNGHTHIFEFLSPEIEYNKEYVFDLFLDKCLENKAVNNSTNFSFVFKKEMKQKIQNSETKKPEIKKEKENKPQQFPDFPIIPPNFPNFNKINKENHTYPSFVDKFTKINRVNAYKEIYDRTFAVKFGVKLNNNSSNDFRSTNNGTAWLLDYHKINDNKYKLFLATNLHVAGDLSNTLSEELNKKLNYEDPRGNKAIAISLGKSSQKITDFEAKNNKFIYGNQEKYRTKWLASDNRFTDYGKTDFSAEHTKFSDGISAPKLIFAGYDFIKDEYVNQFQKEAKEKLKEKIKSIEDKDEDDKDSEYWIANNALKNQQKFPFYTDFAVFEVEIDMSKMASEYAQWFKDSISGLDAYLTRLSNTNVLPNQDKSVSKYMLTKDYITSHNEIKNPTQNNLWNSKEAYIAGYVGIDNGYSAWSLNNPIERNSSIQWAYRSPENKEAFAVASYNYEEKVTTNNFYPYTSVHGKVLLDRYGFNETVWFSSLYYGASGSLVYNDFGQMIGIYSSVASSVNLYDLSKQAGFTPFLLSQDYGKGDKKIKAYNLIDGSDKNLYPAQKASFRENLRVIYPNGFDDKGSTTTALFENGF
ncbi:hypothetical protein E1I18_02040 [Mycoplasmopsis mucosicanis]|uniref:DUF31 domain-containing protein n=1 Tax=Mycoplasmopsis mucosicanis TaxID=458208 RepID=A0A507SQY1_9BACT|nr:DUF31 family protein [Mycoplasmopsis mucosicanis]TQC51553.1 hypothetical protein E1I18_02040 [Mycoplasmopsis mucosicanis]